VRRGFAGNGRSDEYEMSYIGIAGIGKDGGGGIRGRVKSHHKKKKGWTHYSMFEVHDNVGGDDSNKQKGSRSFTSFGRAPSGGLNADSPESHRSGNVFGKASLQRALQ
jgi:hypothetical protein